MRLFNKLRMEVDMNEAKHTPSPWWVDYFGNGDVRVVVDPVKGMPPPICDGRTFVCKLYQHDERGIDAKANARLIAAAPELLAILSAIIDLNPQLPMGYREEAEAAIAKATGGAA